ncbi:hypothetical protein H0W26_06150 [Candidatus Dependentiae bacterium]|nr:hypothetical protein [Candidatus Dependentiae bacterium]
MNYYVSSFKKSSYTLLLGAFSLGGNILYGMESINLFPATSSESEQGTSISTEECLSRTWHDSLYIDNDSSLEDDKDPLALYSYSSETSSPSHSGNSVSSSEQDFPSTEKKTALGKLCERPFDFLLFSPSVVKGPSTAMTQQNSSSWVTDDILGLIFGHLWQLSIEEYLPARYDYNPFQVSVPSNECSSCTDNQPLNEYSSSTDSEPSNQSYPLYKEYQTLRSNYLRLSLVCRQLYKVMRVNAIQNILFHFFRCRLNSENQNILMNSPSSDCTSFSNHLFEQLKKMPLNVEFYTGFEILPSSETPHGIIYCNSLSLKKALSKAYKVLYDISREKALTSGDSPSGYYQNYCDYLIKSGDSKTQAMFIRFIKNCCFKLEEKQYSLTFQPLISHLQTFIKDATYLSLRDVLKKREILSSLDMLYQLHYSYTEERLDKIANQIKVFFLPYHVDDPSESLGQVPPKVLNKCKKYSILRRALLEALLPINEKTTEFVKTYIACADQLVGFTDFLKTYLTEAPLKDRINLIDTLLESLDLLASGKRFNLELIGCILNQHLKEKTYLKDDETADSIIVKALKNHKGYLIEYIPDQWKPSTAKKKELIDKLHAIKKDYTTSQGSTKLDKLIIAFSSF